MELKPCPFCGGEAELPKCVMPRIECKNKKCKLTMKAQEYNQSVNMDIPLREQVIKRWNTRNHNSVLEQKDEEIKELKQELEETLINAGKGIGHLLASQNQILDEIVKEVEELGEGLGTSPFTDEIDNAKMVASEDMLDKALEIINKRKKQ